MIAVVVGSKQYLAKYIIAFGMRQGGKQVCIGAADHAVKRVEVGSGFGEGFAPPGFIGNFSRIGTVASG